MRAAGRDQHVVDRSGQVLEEPPQGGGVGGVERRGARGPDLARRGTEPVGVAAGDDDVGAFGPGPPGGLEPDARAAADEDDGLPGQLGAHSIASRLFDNPPACASIDSAGADLSATRVSSSVSVAP